MNQTPSPRTRMNSHRLFRVSSTSKLKNQDQDLSKAFQDNLFLIQVIQTERQRIVTLQNLLSNCSCQKQRQQGKIIKSEKVSRLRKSYRLTSQPQIPNKCDQSQTLQKILFLQSEVEYLRSQIRKNPVLRAQKALSMDIFPEESTEMAQVKLQNQSLIEKLANSQSQIYLLTNKMKTLQDSCNDEIKRIQSLQQQLAQSAQLNRQLSQSLQDVSRNLKDKQQSFKLSQLNLAAQIFKFKELFQTSRLQADFFKNSRDTLSLELNQLKFKLLRNTRLGTQYLQPINVNSQTRAKRGLQMNLCVFVHTQKIVLANPQIQSLKRKVSQLIFQIQRRESSLRASQIFTSNLKLQLESLRQKIHSQLSHEEHLLKQIKLLKEQSGSRQLKTQHGVLNFSCLLNKEKQKAEKKESGQPLQRRQIRPSIIF